MRNVMFTLVLAAAGVIGLASAPTAEAYDSGRVYVGIGDVTFSYGRPYYRHNHEPLHVVYDRGHPRYYRVVTRPVYYAPPPPVYYAPVRDYRYGYYDYRHAYRDYGYRDYRHDRRHDRRHNRHRDW